ncbi:MAG: ribosome biogenesis factor YjgA [Myxococcota bacterium]
MPNPRLYGDVDYDADPDEDLSSRSDARRANREVEETLSRLAKQLVELRVNLLEKLELPEALFDVIRDAQALRDARAKNRQLRLVRSALRDSDWSLISARTEALLKHGAIPASLTAESPALAARAPEWAARLIGGGNEAIEALVAEYPEADRSHLRNLVREVLKANAERRARAEARLTQAVRLLLR